MDIKDFTPPQAVVTRLRTANKAQLLHELARLAAPLSGIDAQVIEKALVERERLGSTGIGRCAAVPHARIPGLKTFHGFFARLAKPVDFEAVDQQPTDLVFLLLAPENAPKDQIGALAQISRLFRDSGLCDQIRRAKDEAAIYALIAGSAPRPIG